MTGYAVRAAITQTLGHFWSEGFGQIYPTLTGLTARGEIRPAEPGRTSGSRFRAHRRRPKPDCGSYSPSWPRSPRRATACCCASSSENGSSGRPTAGCSFRSPPT
ncbi:MAG: hypothetical protein IPH03_12030 [Tetrasphaera sp.]|nr:hypothetical protein [Tetrasphaera sp.]